MLIQMPKSRAFTSGEHADCWIIFMLKSSNNCLVYSSVEVLSDFLGNLGQGSKHELAVAVHLSFDDGSFGIITGQVYIIDGKFPFSS